MRSKFWFWIVLPLSILSVGEFFLPWYVSVVHAGVMVCVVVLTGAGIKEFLKRSFKIVWITLPVFFFTLWAKRTGLFLGWFYLDPVIDYGILLLRLLNFTISFWVLQKLWVFPFVRLKSMTFFRVFWMAFRLAVDMWNDLLFWPKQRFSLRNWIERRYEIGIQALCDSGDEFLVVKKS